MSLRKLCCAWGLFTLVVAVALPAAAGDITIYTDEGSFLEATADLELTVESFQGFEPGTCLDVFCESDGINDGEVTFHSPLAEEFPENYVPIQTVEIVPGIEDGFNQVLAGGFADFIEETSDTIISLDFSPSVQAVGFDIVELFGAPAVFVTVVPESSPAGDPFLVLGDSGHAFFGAVSTFPISMVIVEPAFPGLSFATTDHAESRSNAGAGKGKLLFNDDGDAPDLLGSALGDYALDDLAYASFPPPELQPPSCERIFEMGAPTTEIQGMVTADPQGGGLQSIELITDFPDNLTLIVGPELGEIYSESFVVLFDGQVPAADGVVLATDFDEGSCTLVVDFRSIGGGPVVDDVICQDNGILLQISNPPPDEMGPDTPEGVAACSGEEPDVEDFPPGYEPSPADDPFPCRELIIDSPVSGETEMVYKKDGVFDPRLRLLFSEFDDGAMDFPPYVDITRTIEEIADVVPDPARVTGKAQWSPVRITCALLDPNCSNPALEGIDDDMDGFPLCENGMVRDCEDQNAAINEDALEGTSAPSSCNGLDDDCDGEIDEEFDPDGDDVAACFDNCPEDFNPPSDCGGTADPPTQCDVDGDGVGDVCDNCPFDFNPGQEDSNGDGIGDACTDDEDEDEDWEPTLNLGEQSVDAGSDTGEDHHAAGPVEPRVKRPRRPSTPRHRGL